MGGSVGERKISRSYNPCPVPCPGDNDAEFSAYPVIGYEMADRAVRPRRP